MRVTLPAAYMPHPGATITATFLHNMVDNATLDKFEDADILNTAGVLPSTAASGSHGYVVFAPGSSNERQLTWGPRTEVSLVGMPHWLSKTYAAFYDNDKGYVPYKGLPCLVPNDTDDSRGTWSGMASSQYSLGGWWHLPRITLDNVLWHNWHSSYLATVYPDNKYCSGTWGVVADTMASAKSMVKVVEHGYCEALVHASFSSNISGPGVYALRYDFTNNDHFPVATQTISATDEAATITELPLGVVRQVYTASGVTLLPYVYANESSATSVPYYVAKIFFSGFGCL